MTTAGKPPSSQGGERIDGGRARLLVASERLRALEAEFFDALDDVCECRPNRIRSLARLEGLRVQLIAVACQAYEVAVNDLADAGMELLGPPDQASIDA
jgi:hypothetical protein